MPAACGEKFLQVTLKMLCAGHPYLIKLALEQLLGQVIPLGLCRQYKIAELIKLHVPDSNVDGAMLLRRIKQMELSASRKRAPATEEEENWRRLTPHKRQCIEARQYLIDHQYFALSEEHQQAPDFVKKWTTITWYVLPSDRPREQPQRVIKRAARRLVVS